MIKIWVDDERPMPKGYDFHFKSVWETLLNYGAAVQHRRIFECSTQEVLLDIDHDSGEYYTEGGDYINILKALSDPKRLDETIVMEGDTIKVHFHSANPVGVKNMRSIVENCPWLEEVKND